jgi:hypothetical protein
MPQLNTPTTRRLAALAFAAKLLLAAGGAALLATEPPPAFAQAAATAAAKDTDAAFASAFARFQQASAGESGAADDAAAQFTRLLAAQPADPVLRAYAGAATTMRARGTLLPWRKLGHAEDGLALIDKALAQLTPAHDAPGHHGVPTSLETRFVAAGTFLGLPGMFNRGARGAKLLDEVAHSPLLDSAPLPFRGAVWLRIAQQAQADKHPAEARRWLDKVIAAGAPQAAAAQAQIREL